MLKPNLFPLGIVLVLMLASSCTKEKASDPVSTVCSSTESLMSDGRYHTCYEVNEDPANYLDFSHGDTIAYTDSLNTDTLYYKVTFIDTAKEESKIDLGYNPSRHRVFHYEIKQFKLQAVSPNPINLMFIEFNSGNGSLVMEPRDWLDLTLYENGYLTIFGYYNFDETSSARVFIPDYTVWHPNAVPNTYVPSVSINGHTYTHLVKVPDGIPFYFNRPNGIVAFYSQSKWWTRL